MLQPDQGLPQPVSAYGQGKAAVIERILNTLKNIRCIRKCANDLYARRTIGMPLIRENGIDQVMAEIHTFGPVMCVQQWPVFQRYQRPRRENQQIPLSGRQFTIDRANHSLGACADKAEEGQPDKEIGKCRGRRLRDRQDGDVVLAWRGGFDVRRGKWFHEEFSLRRLASIVMKSTRLR
ncbi:hypothetical protein [Agrobacterium tumefaciens]|uniref:hypothetical protein n=1 Tax=Agrobacterium tumefaciens TaxID=358 RepID=UPI0021CF6AAD|nr:hypothetical protein [Agrobacterium tumefaciens]